MARRKHEEPEGISGGWINTFADLMNLLLCFFVLLFSMSTVDADKYEQIVTSMSESINIFDGGGKAIGEGAFVSSGTDQLVSISQYFNEFENTGEQTEAEEDQPIEDPGEQKSDDGRSSDDQQSNPGAKGEETGQSSETDAEEKFRKAQEADQKRKAEALYNEVSQQARNKNIDDQININMDKKYQFVQISLNGAILFDSGQSEIKPSSRKLLSKVGDILMIYDKNMKKIEGHTDNVPISGGVYRNNMWLSTARATEVFEYFRHEKGLDPEMMEPTGRSSFDPVATNKTEEGRKQNRRVELKIYTDNNSN